MFVSFEFFLVEFLISCMRYWCLFCYRWIVWLYFLCMCFTAADLGLVMISLCFVCRFVQLMEYWLSLFAAVLGFTCYFAWFSDFVIFISSWMFFRERSIFRCMFCSNSLRWGELSKVELNTFLTIHCCHVMSQTVGDFGMSFYSLKFLSGFKLKGGSWKVVWGKVM